MIWLQVSMNLESMYIDDVNKILTGAVPLAGFAWYRWDESLQPYLYFYIVQTFLGVINMFSDMGWGKEIPYIYGK